MRFALAMTDESKTGRARTPACFVAFLIVVGIAAWACYWVAEPMESLFLAQANFGLAIVGAVGGGIGLLRGWSGPRKSGSHLLGLVAWLVSGACLAISILSALPSESLVRRQRITCRLNGQILGKQIVAFAKQEGRFPEASNWCDIAVTTFSLSPRQLACPILPGSNTCGQAYNGHVAGRKVSEVPGDCVLLFESRAGWNAAGGSGLFQPHGHSWRLTQVVFADGSSRRVLLPEVGKLRWTP